MFKEYFGHDYNARLDYKVRVLRTRMGFEGYGLFWMLVEELYCNGGALPLYGIEVLAKCYNIRVAKIRSVVMDFGLFEVDEEAGTFSSRRVGEELDRRKTAEGERKAIAANRSAVAKIAAASRWGARQADAEAEQGQCDAGKEATRTQCDSDADAMRDASPTQCDADAKSMRDAYATQCVEDAANKRREENIREYTTEVTSVTSAPASAEAVAEAEDGAATAEALDEAQPPECADAGGAPAPEPESRPPSATLDEAVSVQQYWNDTSGLAKVSKLRNNRLKMLRARIRENGLPGVRQMIDRVAASDFLHGGGGRGFTANFDWCIKPNNYDKIIAGNYDNRPGPVVPPTAAAQPINTGILAGWRYPAGAYGVRPTDAEIREEVRHREVLHAAYEMLTGGGDAG